MLRAPGKRKQNVEVIRSWNESVVLIVSSRWQQREKHLTALREPR